MTKTEIFQSWVLLKRFKRVHNSGHSYQKFLDHFTATCNPCSRSWYLKIPEVQVIFWLTTKLNQSYLKYNFSKVLNSCRFPQCVINALNGCQVWKSWIHTFWIAYDYVLQVHNILIRGSLTVLYTSQPFYHTIQREKKYAIYFKRRLKQVYCLQLEHLPPQEKRIRLFGTTLNWKQVKVEDRPGSVLSSQSEECIFKKWNKSNHNSIHSKNKGNVRKMRL